MTTLYRRHMPFLGPGFFIFHVILAVLFLVIQCVPVSIPPVVVVANTTAPSTAATVVAVKADAALPAEIPPDAKKVAEPEKKTETVVVAPKEAELPMVVKPVVPLEKVVSVEPAKISSPTTGSSTSPSTTPSTAAPSTSSPTTKTSSEIPIAQSDPKAAAAPVVDSLPSSVEKPSGKISLDKNPKAPLLPVKPPLVASEEDVDPGTLDDEKGKPPVSGDDRDPDEGDDTVKDGGEDSMGDNGANFGKMLRDGKAPLQHEERVVHPVAPRIREPEEKERNVLAYFVFFLAGSVAVLMLWRRRQRILAYLIEGRRSESRRRATGASYRKLKSTSDDD